MHYFHVNNDHKGAFMKKSVVFSWLFFAALIQLNVGWAQAADVASGRDNWWQTIAMLVIAIFFFWFILWRPEQKKRKALEELRTSMKKGDKVTAMGILGTIDKVNETTVILKMYDGSKIEMLKLAISEVVSSATASPEESPSTT